MRALVVIALAGIGISGAQASEYSCIRADTMRTVAVVTDSGARCEVRYDKTGSASQVLWHADSNNSYCEGKAKDLVTRLTEAGWNCSAAGVTAATASLPEPLAVPVEPIDGANASNGPSSEGVTGATPPASVIDPSIKLRGTFH